MKRGLSNKGVVPRWLTLLLPATAAGGGLRPNRPVTSGAWFEERWSGRRQRLETVGFWPVRQQPDRYKTPQDTVERIDEGDCLCTLCHCSSTA